MRSQRLDVAAFSTLTFIALVGACGNDNPESPNMAPTASFTVSPASGTNDTLFQFDASGCSDAEDAISVLQVRWDWENDGTWDTQFSVTKAASHQYGTAGTKTVKLEVKDTGELTDDTTGVVTVGGAFEIPEMVLVPAGTFEMGDGVSYCGTDRHQVTLTRSFYLGKYEVTNKEYRDALQWAYDQDPKMVTVLGDSVYDNLDESTVLLVDLVSSICQISFGGGTFAVDTGKDNYPMIEVSWYGAAAYCDWLSMIDGKPRAYNHSTWVCSGGNPYTAVGYRLPTDAEWEYATQCGGERIYPWGNEAPDCSRANYSDCVGSTSSVGSYPAAPASPGLYDMAGNVWEWCDDWRVCSLGTAPVENPTGPTSALYRVVHGGAWGDYQDGFLRCAARYYGGVPDGTDQYLGFRCARSQ